MEDYWGIVSTSWHSTIDFDSHGAVMSWLKELFVLNNEAAALRVRITHGARSNVVNIPILFSQLALLMRIASIPTE